MQKIKQSETIKEYSNKLISEADKIMLLGADIFRYKDCAENPFYFTWKHWRNNRYNGIYKRSVKH